MVTLGIFLCVFFISALLPPEKLYDILSSPSHESHCWLGFSRRWSLHNFWLLKHCMWATSEEIYCIMSEKKTKPVGWMFCINQPCSAYDELKSILLQAETLAVVQPTEWLPSVTVNLCAQGIGKLTHPPLFFFYVNSMIRRPYLFLSERLV